MDVLVSRLHQPRVHLQAFRQSAGEAGGVLGGGGVEIVVRGQQGGVFPHRLAIRPPMGVNRPARQLLARIMLAHIVGERRALAPERGELADQPSGIGALGRPQRVDIPFLPLMVGGGDEGRLAAHGQADIALQQGAVHPRAARQNVLPLPLRIGFGDARRLGDAPHLHMKIEIGLGILPGGEAAGNGGGGLRRGRGGERDMPLPREQAGGGVQPHPARAGQIHLRPGVQIREIGLRPRRALHRLRIGGKLDEIT